MKVLGKIRKSMEKANKYFQMEMFTLEIGVMDKWMEKEQ
jgi:hypothetical protein